MRLRPQSQPFRYTLGQRGERMAWDYLKKNGYTLLETNYSCKIGELDVIARKNGRLVFIEIKTRRSSRYGSPEEAVHQRKQKKILRVAEWYLKERQALDSPVSFEVLAIDWHPDKAPEIRLIPDAFSLDQEDYDPHR